MNGQAQIKQVPVTSLEGLQFRLDKNDYAGARVYLNAIEAGARNYRNYASELQPKIKDMRAMIDGNVPIDIIKKAANGLTAALNLPLPAVKAPADTNEFRDTIDAKKADTSGASKKAEKAQKPEKEGVLKGEDDKNLTAALSEIKYFVSRGDKATQEDRKRLEARLEKVDGIVDYFSPLKEYYFFESKNNIADIKAQMAKNGVQHNLSDDDFKKLIKIVNEGYQVEWSIGSRKFHANLNNNGKIVFYEIPGLKEAIKKGNYDGAREAVEGACKKWFAKDELAQLSGKKANYYLEQENYGIAAEHATEAIRLDPGNAILYSLRGSIYAANETYDKAIADYTKAIGLDNSNSDYYSSRGDAYYESGEYRKAIADYKMAKENAGDGAPEYVEDLNKRLEAANGKLAEEGKAPQKTEARGGVSAKAGPEGAAELVKSAKKQVLPISKVGGFYDREVARLANQTGESVEDTKATYTEEEVNRVFKKAGDYVALQSGGKILPKDWETKLIGGELKLGQQQLAILESVCALWLGRTEAYAKASFDNVLKAGDANSALFAIYDKKTGKSQIVEEMKTDGRKIGEIATKYWRDVAFKKIAGDVPVEAAKKERELIGGPIGDIRSLLPKQDLRGTRYEKILGGQKQEPAVETSKADLAKEAAKARISELCSITNDIGGAVKLGVLMEGSKRSGLRGKGAGGRIFKSNGNLYALSAEYIETMGVAEALVKAEGRKIAKSEAPLEMGNVQEFRKAAIVKELVKLGAVEVDKKNVKVNISNIDQKTAILGYLKDGKFTPGVKDALESIAAGGAKLEAGKPQEKPVERPARTTITRIEGKTASPPQISVTPEQKREGPRKIEEAPKETETTQVLTKEVTVFGGVFLTEKVTLPQWLENLGNDEGVKDAAQKLGSEKLTAYLKTVSDDIYGDKPSGKYKQGAFTAAKLAKELEVEAVKDSKPQLYDLLVNSYTDVVKAVMANGKDVIGTEQKAKDAIDMFVREKAYEDKMYDDTNDAAKWANRIVPYYQASLLKSTA